jgi:hypothetical protein
MMSRVLLLVAACCAGLAGGCASQPQTLTPDQRSAIETREIDGQRDDVLRAAAAVMLDEGYMYSMSDHEAGLLAGVRLRPGYADYYARQGGAQCGYFTLSRVVVWVRGVTPSRCQMRVQFSMCGETLTDERQVAEIWTKVQQRMLAYMPPAAVGGRK